MGTDPWIPDPTEIDLEIDGDYIYLGYRYDPSVEDPLISIRQSTNLLQSSWGPLNGELLYREALPDQREEVFFRSVREGEAGFYRLGVE